ncbi:MAG TPA: FmdE family protein [Chloroflexia bacterium]|nr:FmdE family protein [Chloroflexia bacterium]
MHDTLIPADLQACLDRAAALHHHLCPRQVLGVRAGMHASGLFDLPLPQTGKRLFAFIETDGCFADGVSVATGCWLGRRTMRLVDYGKVAVTFVDTATGTALRVSPQPTARDLAPEYAPGEPDAWHAQLAAYRVMPAPELLRVQEVRLTVSLPEIISRPGLRATCRACGEEIMNAREVLSEGGAFCRRCAGRDSYYDPCPV